MKMWNLKKKVVGPVLLLFPMACMHLGDGHHSSDYHSSVRQASHQSSIYEGETECVTGQGWMPTHQSGGPGGTLPKWLSKILLEGVGYNVDEMYSLASKG